MTEEGSRATHWSEIQKAFSYLRNKCM